MADYVLVHGGRSSGAVWDKVVPLLEKEGHTVLHPTLTDPEKTTLHGHISEVCTLIEHNLLEHVILVGHSYGGLVITGVADRMPDRTRRLVYIDSVVPENGKSLYGIMESYGMSYREYGLVQDKPFIEPLFFNEETIRIIWKTYVHCTKSEFLEIGSKAFAEVLENARRDHWVYYELDTVHSCMVTMPAEVAKILLAGDGRSR
jgi:pimeloyl-ACP methyl ester carboxylesterase